MDEGMLRAIECRETSGLSEPVQVALCVAEEIHRENGASEATLAQARKLFSPPQLVELCMVAGYYLMTAGFLKSLAIDIEETPPLGVSMTHRPGAR